MASKTTIRLFVSHSSEDKELATRVVELLQFALRLRDDEIRCTSVEGYGLPGGATTGETLRFEVQESEAFLGLVSERSSRSPWVLFELGARWGARKPLLPLLSPGTSPDFLGGPLEGIHALRADNRAELYQLVSDLSRELKVETASVAAYEKYVDRILKLPLTDPPPMKPAVTSKTPLPTRPRPRDGLAGAYLSAIKAQGDSARAATISIAWRPHDSGLDLQVSSRRDKAIHRFRLFVSDIRRRASSGQFVEVPEYHQRGQFLMEELRGSGSLYCETIEVYEFLRVTAGGGLQFPVVPKRPDRPWVAIHKSGVWQVTFKHESAEHKNGSVHLEFQWTQGDVPKPWSPPSTLARQDQDPKRPTT